MIMEKAYAKLNLSLKVIGKMDNGFHELESIMVPICDLYDELYFEENDSYDFNVSGFEVSNNSVLKAAYLFQKKYNPKGANIRLVKRIPLEAGLAGGSADSSATLRGLNSLFNLNLSLKELEECAKELGSDNVFCLYNRAAICTGRGEKLNFIDFDFEFNVLLIKPKFGLLTKDVFANLKIVKKTDDINSILTALRNNDLKLLDNSIFNDLLPSALEIEPRLMYIKSEIEKQYSKCHMSGSGTTLYVIGGKELNLDNVEYVYLNKHLIKNAVND